MNDPRRLRLYFDYVDPASLLLERRLRSLEGPTTFFLDLIPFELAPPPTPRPPLEESITFQRWQELVDEGDPLGIRMKRPWLVPWSRKAHELAIHGEGKGCFRQIHDTLFRAYLVDGSDIGRVDVLVELAAKHDLDAMETKAALDIDLHGRAVEEARVAGREAGVREPPTLIWLDRTLTGYPDEEDLARFLALDE